MALWSKENIVLTKLGEIALSKAEAGIGQINVLRAIASNDWTDGDLTELTELAEVMELSIIRKYTKEGSTSTCIDVQLNNKDLLVGFTLNSIGIYASHEDINNGDPFLYMVAQADQGYGDAVPPITKTPALINYSFCLMNFASSQVTVVIDPSGLITSAEMESHVQSKKPHPNTPSLSNDVTDISRVSAIWVEEMDDADLHRITINGMQMLILGDDASTIKSMRSRLRQLEMGQANSQLRMADEGQIVDNNMSYVENFKNPSKIDRFSVQVVSVAAGDDSIDVESVSGIYVGSHYTITDGIAQEAIVVKSCVHNGDKYRIIVEEAIKNKYTLANTKIYRSTLDISNGQAYGSGIRRGLTYVPSIGKFEGVKGDSTSTISLETSYSNKDNLTVKGAVQFTSDNMMTIKDAQIAGIALISTGGSNGRWAQYEEVQ